MSRRGKRTILARCEDVEWGGLPKTPAAFGRSALAKPLAALAPEGAEVSVLFTSDRRIRALNRAYRRIGRSTDVLAFALAESGENPQESQGILGDIVVSLDTARRQAADRGVGAENEVALLLLHGLLHLLGHDHATAKDKRAMMDLQNEWLKRLGFAAM
ncbi:MAG: rRNA maturation RNase YbeY [Candidatus Sumerlaeota bacterium]|nr:rRNA maturation RNase YbeY [Candidatus Sumerlaeota bacterium]